MTRQRLAQIRRNERGMCAYCDNQLHPGSKTMCYTHLKKKRAYYRDKCGFSPGRLSGLGRPAIPANVVQFTPPETTKLPDQAA